MYQVHATLSLFMTGSCFLCRELFEAMDTDRSGGLDANELAEGLLSRGYRVSKEEMDQLIDRMDLNQDGNIAFDEFSSALVDWKKVRARLHPSPSSSELPDTCPQSTDSLLKRSRLCLLP